MKMFRNLKADEIECRIAQIEKTWCSLLLYKDARCDMNILDETVGALNWKRGHIRDNANCIVSIYDRDKKEWVPKEDTGTESFSEAEKGLASDSFKRACVNWGIGRELYTSPAIFIIPRKDMIKKGKDGEFFEYKEKKYTTKTRFKVEYIDYDENDNIKDLIIRDDKQNIRFTKLSEKTEKELNKQILEFKKLIEQKEEKDENWERQKLYDYYGVTSDNQLTIKQRQEAIELLRKEN